jgi:pSer/pThr/pTyr-binding forkhead associated (FHA) protein
MVHLQVLSGKKAGFQFASAQLPISVGRSTEADLVLDDPGVFPTHFEISRHDEVLVCQAHPNALISVNGKPVERATLRGGDIIGMGALNIAFSLSPPRQTSLRLREWLTWIGLAAVCLVQIALIYLLNR